MEQVFGLRYTLREGPGLPDTPKRWLLSRLGQPDKETR